MQPPSHRHASRPFGAFELGMGTLASRLLGFLRDAAIAALLGGGWVTDAFLVAFRLPNFARRLLAEGAFAYALVPGYQAAKKHGKQSAAAFTRTVTLILSVFFLAICLAGILFSREATLLLAPGLAHSPQTLATAAIFLSICLSYLPLAAGASVMAATLMAEKSFRAPAYAPAIFNLTILGFAAIAGIFCGTGSALAPYALCVGVVLAGGVQWAWLLRTLRSMEFSLAGPCCFRDANIKKTLCALPGSVSGAAGNQINILVAAVLASFMAEGSISALYFAERLIEFPLGVIGASLGLATLANISRPAREGAYSAEEQAVLAANALRATRLALFFALPAAVGIACLAFPITSLVFGHGEFGAEPLAQTSAALMAYAVGLPALAAAKPFLAIFGALRDAKTPWKSALIGLTVTTFLGGLSLAFGTVWVVAFSVSAAAWASCLYLGHIMTKRGLTPVPSIIWILKTCVACAAMAGCVLWARSFCVTDAATVLLCIPLGILVYTVTAWALRLEESSLARSMALAGLRRKGH